ncbi:hypothetical protein [Catenuloplanes atrovinosus]|uniref:Uncharacterized protein n=1 Tax=Catenuloplanes atrovinosus TaxID=137266 RepID=A0AAE3YUP7_9ACTN|nr:hypothetical protein [Catenuloplanes atrovinosus]MDR7280249.1 hypothetical protein [Catenuloplanes atrovinosus]
MTTEQPPGAPPANPYEELTNAYYAPGRGGYGAAPQAMWAPPPTRSWKGPVAVGAVALVMVGFGAVFGANEFARTRVCEAVAASTPAQTTTATTAGTPAVQTTRTVATEAEREQSAQQLRDEIDATRRFTALLVVDTDLKVAVNGLTTDVETMLRLNEEVKTITAAQRTEYAQKVVTVAQDLDGHWRAAQRACGQAETGLFPAQPS